MKQTPKRIFLNLISMDKGFNDFEEAKEKVDIDVIEEWKYFADIAIEWQLKLVKQNINFKNIISIDVQTFFENSKAKQFQRRLAYLKKYLDLYRHNSKSLSESNSDQK